MFNVLSVPVLFAFSLSLSAQAFSYLEIGQWIGDKYVLGFPNRDGYVAVDFKGKLASWQDITYAPLPNGQPNPEGVNRFTYDGDDIQRPKLITGKIGQSKVFFTDFNTFSVVYGAEPRVMQLACYIGGEWAATCELETMSQGAILPLRNGNFIVGLRDGHQVDENKHDRNPFGIYRTNNKGKLQLFSMIDFASELQNVDIGKVTVDLASGIPSIAFTEDHYTYINPAIGMMWTFSKSNGRLVRSRALYPEVIDALKSNKKVVPPIIWAQPTADNEILISAWSSKLCIEGGELQDHYDILSRTGYGLFTTSEARRELIEDRVKMTEAMQQQMIDIDPTVRWYRYNPANGTFAREPYGPRGAKDIIESREEYRKYRTWSLNDEGAELYYLDLNKTYSMKSGEKIDFSELTWQFSIEPPPKHMP